MNKILFLLITLYSSNIITESLSIMNLNAQNLFDTLDDPKKDDKAFLPLIHKDSFKHKDSCNNITVKKWRMECLYLDWNEETKNAKLSNLKEIIVAYSESGADVVALQEVENINILNQLFDLLKPYGYVDYQLLESKDKRGVDTAFISKFKILDPKLHYVEFSSKYETKDTRPIFEITIDIDGKKVKFYNNHFPSNFHDLEMRIESFDALKELHKQHSMPSIALGDFNVSLEDDIAEGVYESQEDQWLVAHREGCNDCKGTYFYNYTNTWQYLDTIMISNNRNISYDLNSIDVFKTATNTYKDTGKPAWFNPETLEGVSDHFPMVAVIRLD
jgi:endonuclease/exonuclease/phosphatase family metal-dependent hydrolase